MRWPDGTLFIGNKVTDFYALDLASGRVVYRYEHGPGLTCPSDEVARAFAGDSPTLLLIAKSIYSLACLGPSNDLISPAWNITYIEFGGFVSPFRESISVGVRHSSNSLSYEDELEVYSSFNGMIIVRDIRTKQILWARRLTSTATAFFSLADHQESEGGDVEGKNLGPALKPIPISATPFSLSQTSLFDPSTETMVNLGRIEETLYVLSTDRFPTYQGTSPPDDSDEAGGRPMIAGRVNVSISSKLELAPFAKADIHTCFPGSPDFPDCLLGRIQVARILRPVPLLRGVDREAQRHYIVTKSILIGAVVILLSALWMTLFRLRRHHNQQQRLSHGRVAQPSSVPPPPGFEEISISSADIFYSTQSDTNTDALHHPRSFLVSDQVIGYGSHGTVVFRGTYDGRPVAVKRMLIDFYDIAGHEVRLLQQSDHHPNVVRYYCREVTERFAYIVLELCVGSLADLVEDPASSMPSEQNPLSELRPKLLADLQALLHQMTSGLAHLHTLNLVHRDIKPHNILITPQGRLVLSDFGVSKKLAEDQTSFNPTVAAGTVGWRAPECILTAESLTLSSAKPKTQIRVTKSLDIFALGCVFYYVLSGGDHPFGGRLEREMNIVKNAVDLSRLSSQPEAADLVQRMLSRQPDRRPNCRAILAHPYFWPAQRQIAFLLDVSDRFEVEDRLASSEILRKLESRRSVIFEGSLVWHKLIDSAVWIDLCNYRKYNPHSARDLLRALRNKRNHFHELSLDLRRILGETPEAFMRYFLERFPRLLIEIYRLVEGSPMRRDNPFASVYFHDN